MKICLFFGLKSVLKINEINAFNYKSQQNANKPFTKLLLKNIPGAFTVLGSFTWFRSGLILDRV